MALHGTAPQYLKDLLKHHHVQRSLRSSDQQLLHVPSTRLKTFGDRAFSVYAPRLWNSLPMNIKTSASLDIFKKNVKSYLFCLSYGQ